MFHAESIIVAGSHGIFMDKVRSEIKIKNGNVLSLKLKQTTNSTNSTNYSGNSLNPTKLFSPCGTIQLGSFLLIFLFV